MTTNGIYGSTVFGCKGVDFEVGDEVTIKLWIDPLKSELLVPSFETLTMEKLLQSPWI